MNWSRTGPPQIAFMPLSEHGQQVDLCIICAGLGELQVVSGDSTLKTFGTGTNGPSENMASLGMHGEAGGAFTY